jgi:imidazolonepropionase-like amidohydrolase
VSGLGGERDVKGAAFYVPTAEFPDLWGLLVQALLKSGGKLPLLPAGEARLEKSDETTVSAGGQTRRLICYTVTGLELTPRRVWMNEDGSWFGIVRPWWSVVPEGWESVIDPLIARQDKLVRARDAALAAETAHKPPAAGLAYVHARVLDVEQGRWLADQTVVVTGDKIAAVGPSKSVKPPAGAEVIDLAGKALLPGLWDMHAHLDEESGALYLAAGVTTVRDVGNDPDQLDDWKARYDHGQAAGPHVYRYGIIEGRGAKAASSKVTAETPEEAKSAVALYAKRGYDGIKIYNSVRPELVPLIAKEAHQRGMQVTGHVPVHMLANEAVRAGYDGIEHVNMLMLNFFATHDTDTRDTTRFTLVGDQAAALDLKSAPVRDFVALLKQHHTVVDPTIGAFEDLYVGETGKITPGLEWMVTRLPALTQRAFLVGGLASGAKVPLYRDSFTKILALVKLLADEKVPVVVGTDNLAGLFVHHELALYVRAGIAPAEALRMATLTPAKLSKREQRSGSIAAGKDADLFVVDGDPLADIAQIRKVVSTMRGGVVFASAPLYQAYGVKP